MDISKSIRIAVDTGRVAYGAETARKALLNKEAKLVVITSNTPDEIKHDVWRYAKLSEIPVLEFAGSSLDLGATCGRPHFVSVLTIFEVGDSDIMKALEVQE